MLQLTENDSIAISNKFVSQSSILPHFRDLHLQGEARSFYEIASPWCSDVQMSDFPLADVADGGCRTFECKCCKLEFLNEANLNVHWRSEAHLVQIISDGDKKWEQRPPPRGVSAEQYQLCEWFVVYLLSFRSPFRSGVVGNVRLDCRLLQFGQWFPDQPYQSKSFKPIPELVYR